MLRHVRRVIARGREWLDPILRGVDRARTLGLAAEMSFWLFLSLVPLAAVAGLLNLFAAAPIISNGCLAFVIASAA